MVTMQSLWDEEIDLRKERVAESIETEVLGGRAQIKLGVLDKSGNRYMSGAIVRKEVVVTLDLDEAFELADQLFMKASIQRAKETTLWDSGETSQENSSSK